MAGPQSRGKCAYCEESIAKSWMTRHFEKCKNRKIAMKEVLGPPRSKGTEMPIYHLEVEGAYAPMYWMHLEVPGEFKLKHLDQFLRDIWLECCGHLSKFSIGDHEYHSYTYEDDLKSLDAALCEVLQPGMTFTYEYDFGSTTPLNFRVLGVRQGQATGKVLQIMARNEQPADVCYSCGEPATQVCTQCMYADQGLLCEKHAADHECGEEMLLPVVNSPRMGECGYTGPLEASERY
jgi:hypothetical protein